MHAEQALFSYSHQNGPLGHSMCQSTCTKAYITFKRIGFYFHIFNYALVYNIEFQTFSNQNNDVIFPGKHLGHRFFDTFFHCPCHFHLVNTLCGTEIILHSNIYHLQLGKLLSAFFSVLTFYIRNVS